MFSHFKYFVFTMYLNFRMSSNEFQQSAYNKYAVSSNNTEFDIGTRYKIMVDTKTPKILNIL